MTLRPVLLVCLLALTTSACKKKPAVGPVTPTETPATEPPTSETPVDTSTAEPAPTPAPVDTSASVRKQLNGLLDGVNAPDVATQRSTLEQLKSLRSAHPDVAEIDLNIGVLEQKLGNESGAKTAYEEALRKDPAAGHAYLYLGALKEQAGDLTGAEAKYREGLAAAPESVAVRVGLVSTLRKQGRYDEAIAAAQAALKVNSTSPEIYNDVGLAYAAQEDFLLAKFMYRKGLALPAGEEKAYLHANLGWTYYLEGKLPEATFRLKKAVELDREYVPALVYLARVYMEDRNYEDTVELLERAAQREPSNHGVKMNLGIAYRGVERFEDAKRAYEAALALDPSNPAPHFNLGILHGDYLKDYDASVAAFNTYKSAGGSDTVRADEYIAAVQREKKRVEKRSQREAAAKKRESERAEQKRLAAEEAERQRLEEERMKAEEAATPDPAPAPETPAPATPEPEEPAQDAPAEEEAPTEPSTPDEADETPVETEGTIDESTESEPADDEGAWGEE